MADHIEITVLERSLLAEGSFGIEERARIRLHLESCALCREKMDSLKRMYQKVEKDLNHSPSEADRQAAGQILPRGLVKRTPEERIIEAYGDLVEPYKRPIVSRFLRLINVHPYQSTGAFLLVAASLALLLTIVTPTKDQNPTYAEIKNYVLCVYNREADVIWKKGVPGLPDWTSRSSSSPDLENRYRYLSVEDVDGDNVNEVLLVGSSPRGEFANDTLYCFNERGIIRWNAGTGPMMSFGQSGTVHNNRPVIADFVVMRKNARVGPQIFVLAVEQVYSPTKLFEVSARDGRILQSYSNRGGCVCLLHKDVDFDGNQELLLGGVNDGFNQACLAILDPARIAGYSPVPPNEMSPEGTGGKEMYYILFPRWQIQTTGRRTLYNFVRDLIDLHGGGVDVRVAETLPKPGTKDYVQCSLFFNLRLDMSAGRIIADDTAIGFSNILYQQGKIKAPITSETYASLRDSVLYWDGGRFVNSPTMNKNYKAEFAEKALPGISRP